ncbi:MAG: rhomboid family intramembrane serine protease [Armatimonadota bacterium]|nr:rhomboid family intramembrane serine protease [Armatimonadota bacterium]MCX7777508.1 rhomboid family intramembrane serine protease [Armatimonadota bacterium]MDW8025984.1 rhomboid family intramembrane serine protease [Armatimonadota bacterium]
MIPLIDDVGTRMRTQSYITFMMAFINVAIFIWLAMRSLTNEPHHELFRFGLVPARLLSIRAWLNNAFGDGIVPLISFMFMHTDLFHLLSNMLFLWVFGRAVEGRIGVGRFLLLYMISGLASGIGHSLVNAKSAVPVVGASGAVAGILGAYLLLFPGSWVLIFILPVALFGLFLAVPSALVGIQLPRWVFGIIWLPAAIVLPYWFVLQLLNALRTLSLGIQSNIAWWAHIAGFVAGLWLAYKFKRSAKAYRHHN